jgi:hypothetical protein
MTAETHIAEEETRRISELDRLELMYTQPEEVFDRITAQLADIFGAQAAMMKEPVRQERGGDSGGDAGEPDHAAKGEPVRICGGA